MKRMLLLIGPLLISTFAFAKEIPVSWECPSGSQKTTINVSFDAGGKLQFQPDIFAGSLKAQSGVSYGECFANFQRGIDTGLTNFKENECPASKDSFCYASNDYTNSKVIEKLQASSFLKSNTGISLSAITPAAAAKLSGVTVTPQAFLESQIAEKKIDTKNLSATFTHNGRTHKVSDFDKVIGDNIENVFTELSRDEAKQYAQNYMVAKSDFLKPSSNPTKRKAVLDNLNRMFGYVYGDKASEELAKMLECAPEDNLAPIADILARATSNKISKCDPLNPGEHKVFNQESRDPYGTGDYLLRRTADGNYQAVLNVRFNSGSGSLSPSAMMARAKQCLDQVSPFLKGPNGEKLQMSVLTEEEIEQLPANQRPRRNDISIEAPGFATNAARYAQNIDCPVIAHEMLHLLGLCDEYKEDRAMYSGMWECRVETKAPSLMRETNATYRRVMGGAEVCDCSSNTCRGIANSGDENLKKLFISQSIYEITGPQFRTKYCREVMEPASSINLASEKPHKTLADQTSSFSVQKLTITDPGRPPYYQVHKSVFSCQCPVGDQSCLTEKSRILREVSQDNVANQCPAFTSWKRSDYTKPNSEVNAPEMVIVSKRDTGLSMLQPNQFKKILAGNCPGVVDGYLECAEFAYKSLKDGPCNVPAKCRDDSYFLGAPR